MKDMKKTGDSKENFWKEYEKLPDAIKEALFSEDNFKVVSDICETNGISDEEMKSQLMKYIGKTLMGKLPIKDFFVTLELEMDMETNKAKTISREIDRKIFSGLRIALNKIYSSNVAENKIVSDNKKDKDGVEIPVPKKEEYKDPYKESLI
ncbi:MAG: hypothetical protein WC446_01050 [Candidatus Paceibacterota bacterium]|jgi:hypothetical protein